MRVATAYIEMRADKSKLSGDLKGVEREAGGTAEKVTKLFTQAFALGAFAKGVNSAIGSASRLQQAVGATEAVFKSSTRTIDEFAKTSAKSFGISESAARELTAQIGSLLKGFGFTEDQAANTSVKIAKLGADLAAAFGGKPEDAVAALGAALRGEFDPLERFGVSLNVAQANLKAVELGLADSTSKVDLNARAQASLALITERSADVQGQFARESDTAAGKAAIASATMEDSAASLGESLLPIYARAAELVSFLAESFAGLPKGVQMAVLAFVGFIALSGPIKSTIDLMRTLRSTMATATTAATTMGTATVVAAAAYAFYEMRAQKAEALTRAVAKAFEELSRVSDAEVVSTFSSALLSAGTNGQTAEQFMRQLANTNLEGAKRLREVLIATGEWAGALPYLTAAIDEEEAAQARAAVTSDKYKSAQDQAAASSQANATATDELTRALRAAGTEMSDAEQAANDLDAALRKVFGAQMSLEDATQAVADSARTLTKELKDNGKTLDINTEAGSKNRDLLQARVKAVLDLATAEVRAGDSLRDVTARTLMRREAILQEAEAAGISREATEAYLEQLGFVPENVTTAIELTKDEETKRKLGEMIDQLGVIDAGAAAEIKALIEAGQLAEAERKLAWLTRTRTANVNIAGIGLSLYKSAEGRFVPGGSNIATTAGEIPGRRGDEAILPLGNRSRLEQLLADPRIGGPIAEAMSAGGGRASTGVAGGGVGTAVIQFVVNDRVVQEMMVRQDQLQGGSR